MEDLGVAAKEITMNQLLGLIPTTSSIPARVSPMTVATPTICATNASVFIAQKIASRSPIEHTHPLPLTETTPLREPMFL